MNRKNKFIVIAPIIAALLLSSCSQFRCKAEGVVMLRNVGNYPSYEHSKSTTEILEVIKSVDTINEVKDNLYKNANYREYLLDNNFAKYFELKEIDDSEMLSFKYKHSDLDFADAVVNNWIDITRIKTRKYYTPKIANIEEKYKNLLLATSKEKAINSIFNKLNQNEKYEQYLSKQDLINNFNVKSNNSNYTINATYEHSNEEFADVVMETWLFSILEFGEQNYRFNYFEDFKFDKNIIDKGGKNMNIKIARKSANYIQPIQLVKQKCN